VNPFPHVGGSTAVGRVIPSRVATQVALRVELICWPSLLRNPREPQKLACNISGVSGPHSRARKRPHLTLGRVPLSMSPHTGAPNGYVKFRRARMDASAGVEPGAVHV